MNAFVTGGSRGIGRAIVLTMVEKGIGCAFTYANDAGLPRKRSAWRGPLIPPSGCNRTAWTAKTRRRSSVGFRAKHPSFWQGTAVLPAGV